MYVYFDNDARAHAPHDAQRPSARVRARLRTETSVPRARSTV